MSAHGQGEAERHDARRASARLLRARWAVCAAAVLACATVFALAVALPIAYPRWILAVPALLTAVVGAWVAITLFPRPKGADDAGMLVTAEDEPALHRWLGDLCAQLGVDPPQHVRIAPSTGARVDDIGGSPTLVVGAGWLTWLHVAELNRLCSLELSMLRVRDDAKASRAMRLAAGVDVDALLANETPVVGGVIRRVGRSIERHREAVFDACLGWAAAAIPTTLRPTDADIGEGRLADEGWQVLTDRWITPVRRLGWALDSLALPHRELLGACQAHHIIDRTWERPSGPLAITLLADPVTTDAEVARWLAGRHGDEVPLVGWDEYVEQVTLPSWRTSVADVVTAANRVRGSAKPMTLDTLLDACETGSAFAVGALLVGHDADGSVNSQSVRRVYNEALGDAFSHAVSLALVETGLATPLVDVLWGVVLEATDGEHIPVEATVRNLCDADDWASLRLYIESLDLDPSHRLRLSGTFDDPSAQGSDLVAYRRGRVNDVVFAEGCMRVYPRSLLRSAKMAVERMMGLAPAHDSFLGESGSELRIKPAISIALVEVTSAELFRRPHGLAWTLRLVTKEDEVTLTGIGDGARVATIMTGAVRGRTKVTGLGARPSRFLRLLGKAGWYVICGGVLVLMSGLLGYLLGSGDDQGSSTASTVGAVATFGVFGAALIALGAIPYLFVARRGHRLA